MKLDKVIQIGIICVNNAIVDEILEHVLGWLSWGKWETTPGAGRYYLGEEEDFYCKMSFYAFGELELEVIEPVRGRSCWQDYLNSSGGGIHHLLFNVNSDENCRNFLRNNGWRIYQQGRARPYGENVIWAYADTNEDLKFTIEYTNRNEYPQQNTVKRPTVEGMFKNLQGARLLCSNAAAVHDTYRQKLGWERTEDGSYSFGTVKLTVTQPEGGIFADLLKSRGNGMATLIVRPEDTAAARQHIEADGKAVLMGETEESIVYDLGYGIVIELLK